MAEATIKDLIKEIRVSNNMTTRIEEATLGATESVQRSIADLNTMLGKYFLAQNASRGDDLEAQREAKRNAKMKSGPTQAPAAATAGSGGGLSNFLQGLGGLAETAMFGLFAGRGAASAIGTEARTKFLKRLARAPLIGAVALFSEEIVTSVFKGLTGKDIEGEQLDMFTNTLNATLLGSMFGRKGAFAGFMYSVISQSIAKTFPNKDDDESAWQRKTNLLGVELPFTNEDFAVWGGTIASFFAPSLITGAIRRSLGIGGDAAADGAKNANNAAKKSFLKGFKPNMNIVRGGLRFAGWAGFAGLAGYTLVQAIEGIASDGTADTTDLMNLGISAASTMSMIGMFGAKGLLMTGIAGLAIGGGYLIYNYLQKRQAKAEADFERLLAAKEEELSGLSADEAQARYNEAVRVKNQKGKGKQSVSKEDRLNAQAEIQMLQQLFPNLDFAETREKQIENASSPMFYTKSSNGRRTTLYDSTGKPIRTVQGGPPEGLMPLSTFYDMGERLSTSMFTGQTQDTGLFDGLKELTDTTDIQNTRLLANIVRNNNRKLDEFIAANDLMPPDLSGYSGGVGVLDMKDQSNNSSYTYAAGTDRIDPRDKALVD